MRIATLLAAALLLSSPLAKAQDSESCIIGATIILANAAPQTKAPFTATVKTTFDRKLADGNAIHSTVHYHIARDAAGRTMSEMPLNCYVSDDGRRHRAYQVSVYDRTTNTNETWRMAGHETPKIVTIFHIPAAQHLSPAELAAMHARAQTRPITTPQWQVEQLGTREFLALFSTGTRRTQTIPAGEHGNALPIVIVNESWVSPELNLTMMAIQDDPRQGRTTAEIEELHRGDPDPALFSPPEGFIIKEQNPARTPATDPR